ncbi:unnamed protein product, partial [Discosporangium mesarthrocarpum]
AEGVEEGLQGETPGPGAVLAGDLVVVALLRSNTADAKALCAQVFSNLLSQGESTQALVDAGVLWGLVKAAKDGTPLERAECVRTLFNLSCDPGMTDPLMQLGPQNTLRHIVDQTGPETRGHCARVLIGLCAREENAASLAEKSGVVRLMRELLPPAGNEECVRCCARALRLMASCYGHRDPCVAGSTANAIAEQPTVPSQAPLWGRGRRQEGVVRGGGS